MKPQPTPASPGVNVKRAGAGAACRLYEVRRVFSFWRREKHDIGVYGRAARSRPGKTPGSSSEIRRNVGLAGPAGFRSVHWRRNSFPCRRNVRSYIYMYAYRGRKGEEDVNKTRLQSTNIPGELASEKVTGAGRGCNKRVLSRI